MTTSVPVRLSPHLDAPAVSGKFLRLGGELFLVRGVAYGSFAPRADGHQFPERPRVRRDLALMQACGINTVRTYTVPPPDLLDAAAEHGIRVMAGLAWPQHVAFLDDRHLCREIIRGLTAQAATIARHPALLLTAIGNEIPPAVVRWHGTTRVERFIRDAVDATRAVAPDMLLTYVNYPPTEFLELPFLDVHAFNVYLHDEQAMRGYVARLQHGAGHRPLLLAECGADSQRHGETGQARLTSMQVQVAFSEGACGAVVFSWTDEWWRGGAAIDDWSFGLVERERRAKAAHTAVRRVFAAAPFPPEDRERWPALSVVVCAYNAADTIDDCLAALDRIDYPRAEIIVVDDGSTDDTAARAMSSAPWARLIRIPNGGLSAARNVGLHAATGDIVAYVDADVRVDPSWAMHLVQPFAGDGIVAVGGPNVVPADDPWFAQCVARAPGAPSHVLIDDRIAEHIPGCNFAVRRQALLDIGGFDPIFLRAGDDVDVCWRLQDRGGRIGFAPTALVWHHHRRTLRAYWRQQVGYGEGEAWLRFRHRGRFSRWAIAWRGRIYSGLPFVQSLTARRLHAGVWGTAAFPTVYHTEAHPLQALPHTPEWQLAALVLISLGALWMALGAGSTLPLALVALGAAGLATTILKCAVYAGRSDVERLPRIRDWSPRRSRAAYRLTIAWLHVVQPFARAFGFLRGALAPPASAAERAAAPGHARPWLDLGILLGRTHQRRFWSERWAGPEALLTDLASRLRGVRGRGIHVDDGWRCDRDISIALGPWGWAHVQALVEDHGTGRCLVRVRLQVRPRVALLPLVLLAAAAMALEASDGPRLALAALTVAGIAIVIRAARDISHDTTQIEGVLSRVASDYGMQDIPASPRRGAGASPGGPVPPRMLVN